MDRKEFKQFVLNNGKITIGKTGECDFVVVQINDENFNDMTPMLKQQLKDDGKYNSWIGFITTQKVAPYSIQWLPIYGRSDKYVTKWLSDTAEKAIDQNLRDKQVGLLERANDYMEKVK